MQLGIFYLAQCFKNAFFTHSFHKKVL